MLREITHFFAGAPTVFRLKAKLPPAQLYDELMRGADDAGLLEWRRELARGLEGEVLEVGAGTGLMFPHYGEGARVSAVEPDAEFVARASARAESARARVEVQKGAAEALPFASQRFDAVVVSMVLCSVTSVPIALREIARVLRPGGEVRLIEHVRSDGPIAGALMDLLDPVWILMNGHGCHMNRCAEDDLRKSGFTVLETRPFQVFSTGLPSFPMRWIRASPPG